jgi:hypothetical protein
MIKLYLPYGNLRHFAGHEHVTLHWFRKDRPAPIGSYEDLILGYKQMNPEQQRSSERMVDELFTEEEFHALRSFLQRKKNQDVRTGMLVPPVNSVKPGNELGLGLVRPFGDRIEGTEGGFYKLSDEPDYTLPFPVWGYYTQPSR